MLQEPPNPQIASGWVGAGLGEAANCQLEDLATRSEALIAGHDER